MAWKTLCTPRKVLNFLWNIDEMESEGEQCEVSDDDENEDGCELNLSFGLDSDSESDLKTECKEDTCEEAGDGPVWVEQTGSARGKAREFQKMRGTPGPTRYAKDNITSPMSSLMCLIDAEMWEIILKHTQAEADRNNAEDFNLTADELKAFVALIYLSSIMGGRRMKLDDYWSEDFGNLIFIKTMSAERYRDIMRYLRFDDKDTRASRIKTDKFAMISEIFGKFVKNSMASYTPGENITVGEQMFPTKVCCRFMQYMANKPDQFGIKFWMAADVETKYMLNAIPCLEKDHRGPPSQLVLDNVVMHLVKPFLGKGRNVTTENLFTSLQLASSLLEKKTTIVGKMNKTRRAMPPCTQKQSERFSTTVMKSGKVTLTIYQAKPKQNVCILSTMHQTISFDKTANKVPDSVSHYNNTKLGVSVLDQMVRQYAIKGHTGRWPVAVFYNILQLAAINAHILYRQCRNVNINRRKFILELVKDMCEEHREAQHSREMESKRLLFDAPCPPAKRRQCQIGRCSGNKTYGICRTCRRVVCGRCSKPTPKLCCECY